MRQEWAKYLTVCVTGSLIPVEIFEVFRHFGWLKVGVLVVNIVVVAFLILSLIREKRLCLKQAATNSPQSPAPRPTAVTCEPV
jgi:uncharacterized membrane protein (DUF2068 family)